MRTVQVPNIIPASTVMNATINSIAQQTYQVFGYAIQVVFTGTPTGNFKLQASNDPYVSNPTSLQLPTNWTDVADSTFTVTAAGNVMWNVENPMYNWVRVVYTDTSSGASTAIITNADVNVKGL